jgi:L-cystine uptake protein TcyP (sodium:dicarboxylate symporter family)
MFSLETLKIIFALAVFAGLLVILVELKKTFHLGFALRTAAALVIGIGAGVALQAVFGAETASGAGALTRKWINIVGQLFTRSLQIVVVPLVLVSIVNAASKLTGSRQSIAKTGKIIGFLLGSTAVSAGIAIIVTRLFNLNAAHLIEFTESTSKAPDVAVTLVNLVPNNLFAAVSSNSVLPVVLAAAALGWAYLAVRESSPALGERFASFLEMADALVMKLVRLVIGFTPYGVLAISTVRAAQGSGAFIVQLGLIIIASFAALLAVFILHLAGGALLGVSPVVYLRKTAPALLFAFSSRSSAATVPLTIEAQRSLGVGEANANLAAALGTCIGQNGCAGVYPTMLALLVGQVQGWDVWSPAFLIPLVLYVLLASIGTAGVGGGATNVSLLVLSLMGLPVELVAILISVDFIIDMGRTLVNVSDSILAGYAAGKLEHDIDTARLNAALPAEETA